MIPRSRLSLTAIPLCLAAAAFRPALAAAQEHPEHPKNTGAEHPKKGAEHPEHPAQAAKAPAFTTADMSRAIRREVEADAKLKGGKFLVWDPVAGAPLALDLEKVHDDRLSQIGPDTAFVCADFKAAGGKTYDLDFFMTGPDGDHLKVSEITIHKEDGKPRYNWAEKNGIWTRKPL